MADRHNLCVNPSLTNNATGWGGGGTPVRTDVTGLGFLRNWAARYSSGTFVTSPTGAATVGQTYTVSGYVRPQTFQISGTVWIDWVDGGGSSVGSSNQGFTAPAGSVTRISMTGTAPSGAVGARLVITGEDFSINTTDVTAVLIEQAASALDFFDGDSPSASWDGTAGNSASTLAGGSAVSGDVSQTITGTVTATGANAAVGAASQTVTAALTAAGANAAVGAVSQTVTATLTAAGANAAVGGATSTTTAAVTATGANAASGGASPTTSASVTASAQVTGTEATPTVTASVTAEASVTSPEGGSWYTLLDIMREAAAERRAERERVPVACPNDGEPVRTGPRGELHCSFDGWIWNG